jgi:hypothetical protein
MANISLFNVLNLFLDGRIFGMKDHRWGLIIAGK